MGKSAWAGTSAKRGGGGLKVAWRRAVVTQERNHPLALFMRRWKTMRVPMLGPPRGPAARATTGGLP
jgi:hypothetical protein